MSSSQSIRDSHGAPAPLVTVITPTWRRHDALLGRCVPGVRAQAYPAVEHVIVSDGPDPELRELTASETETATAVLQFRFTELPEHDPVQHWGHHARLAALELARGELLAYCDDDDSLRPEHCALLAAALEANPDAGFAVSRMVTHDVWDHEHEVGEGPLSLGSVGTPMIMHRREILETATWGPASPAEDWDLVNRWLQEGIGCARVDRVTCDAWPSAYFSGQHLTTAGKASLAQNGQPT